MYPSGQWEGFWVQEHWGRQAMTPFFLTFCRRECLCRSICSDIIGKFVFTGDYDEATGQVCLVKQYLGKNNFCPPHRAKLLSGEGSIQGTWHIGEFGKGFRS